MEQVTFRLTSSSPLLMHNGRLANPLDKIVKEMKKITAKRKKTDDDIEALARLEFEGGLYWDAKLGPYVPAPNLVGAIWEAAKLSRRGEDVKRGVLVMEGARLEYDGPREVGKMFAGGFADLRIVNAMGGRKGGGKVLRCRPIFKEWGLEFTAYFNPQIIESRQVLTDFVRTAGEVTGIVDGRPFFGRFTSEEVK